MRCYCMQADLIDSFSVVPDLQIIEMFIFYLSDDINENTSKSVECLNSDHQCCPDDEHPQHGPGGIGCCAASEFGCCPDNLTPASSPFLEVTISN